MSLLTKELLEQLGVELDQVAAEQLSEHFETTLDQRVHAEIIEELTDLQLEELTALQNGNDQQLQQWLQVNVPDLKDIIEEETAILLGELAENTENL